MYSSLFHFQKRSVIVIALTFLMSASIAAAARADLDSDVFNTYMYYNAPDGSAARNVARAAFKGSAPTIDATLASLQVVRNWDRLRPETRAKLSPYISLSDWKTGARSVNVSASYNCRTRLNADSNTHNSSTSHFNIYYTTSGSDASTQSYINSLRVMFEEIWAHEITTLGYPAPRFSSGSTRMNVYVCDILGGTGNILGRANTDTTYSDNTASTYIELDNDYAGTDLHGLTAIQFAEVTMAHEFFHAVQFGINYVAASYWLMEATAVWMEDEVYPDYNDYVEQYVVSRFQRLDTPIDTFSNSTTDQYGSSIFIKYITESIDAPSFVFDVWDSINDQCRDIGISSVPDWCPETSTQIPLFETLFAAKSTSVKNVFRGFNTANYTKDYEDGTLSVFPRASYTDVTVANNIATADQTIASSTLKHLSAKFYRLTAPATIPDSGIIASFEGATAGTWQVALIKELSGGSYSTSYMTIDPSTGRGTLALDGFGTQYNNAVLVVNNAKYFTTFPSYESGDQFTLKLTEGTGIIPPVTAIEDSSTAIGSSSFTPAHAFRFSFNQSGTISTLKYSVIAAGNTALVKEWMLYRDTNGNNIIDSGDVFLKTVSSTSASSITFSGLTEPITSGNSYNYLVAVRVGSSPATKTIGSATTAGIVPFYPGAPPSSTAMALILSLLAMTGGIVAFTASRKGIIRAASICVALTATAFIATGCGGGGSSSTSTPISGEATLRLTIAPADITFTDGLGNPITLTGSSITGATITITQ